ncbi:MAG: PrsW family intramembrane metalloprotease [Anaerolineae bacterium]|nr:PrsW family intramembrane metalloprotease [Anaerolineae bacterium]
MLIVAFLIAIAVPLIFLYTIYKLDLYGTGSFQFVLVSFAWGMAAFALALFINVTAREAGLITGDTLRQYFAPVAEEILKALILIYLVRRPNFTYFVDGAVYGFSIGIGFAIVENYSYILNDPTASMGLAIGRVLSTNLMHASASALVGIAVGYARFHRFWRLLSSILTGLFLAMALHIGFNNLVTRIQSGLLLLYAAAVGFGSGGVITLAIRRGLAEEKAWIEETLGEADRVTKGEAAVVHRITDMRAILMPLKQRFGSEKVDQIETFLMLQARLGILRKTLDKLQDEKMVRAVEVQMDDLRREMDEARRSVGTYCMLYLRHIFPEESSPLWGRLEATIQERIAARPAGSGMNLWSDLGRRAARSPDAAGKDDA